MTTYAIHPNEKNPSRAVTGFFSDLLKTIDYCLVPGTTPYSDLPMPMLIKDPEKLGSTGDPLAPAMPFNAARQAASVLKAHTGKTIALLLKPCEKRALVELVKLSQCTLEDAVIITHDCPGRLENKIYLEQAATESERLDKRFEDDEFINLTPSSCQACTQFTDNGSDIHIALFGCSGQTLFSARTDKGKNLLESLNGTQVQIPGAREQMLDQLLSRRTRGMERLRDNILPEIKEPEIKKMERFQKLIATCLNCYNCKTACPVCYCKECVFTTDIFDHMPETLLNRADKKGIIKLPTDTTMFHLTRLAHMSHACVGCGQCSSVCPSEIPVADIFKVVSRNTQDFFGYLPGSDIDEMIPYLNYKKAE